MTHPTTAQGVVQPDIAPADSLPVEPPRDIAAARTLLFVPADRPDRFAKAASSGADNIVLDLEDAVPAHSKTTAREHVRRWREAGGTGLVRINAEETPWYGDDIAALGPSPVTVMLPKTSQDGHVRRLVHDLPAGSSVIPIIETAAGVFEARSIGAVAGVVRLAFGNGDLAMELGVEHTDTTALAYARSHVVLASAACAIAPPLDGVTTTITHDAPLIADTKYALRLGFTGKLCIHPRQIVPVHRALEPSLDDLRWARQVIATANGGVAVADGHMIDAPIVERARHVLLRAPRTSPRSSEAGPSS